MTAVHFFNFSNGAEPISVPLRDYATCDVIAKLAKAHCRLNSRAVEASYDENADTKAATTGSVFAGMRTVGRFRIIDGMHIAAPTPHANPS